VCVIVMSVRLLELHIFLYLVRDFCVVIFWQIEELLSGSAAKNAVRSTASSQSGHSNLLSYFQPLTSAPPLSPLLQQQQEEVMAELQAALSTALKPTILSPQRLTVSENSEQHNRQQQQTQSHQQRLQIPQEAIATHVQPSALTIQQQQEQALAELQAVLMQTQQGSSSSILNASSSSSFSAASVSRNLQPKSSSDAALFPTTESSHRASPLQLQRAPPAPSDDDSDPEFSQFLNEFDNSNS
jgi:hypothetical protein